MKHVIIEDQERPLVWMARPVPGTRLPPKRRGIVASVKSWQCRKFGHRWTDPRIWGDLYGTQCRRCRRIVGGSQDVMEAIGAWKHQ